MVYWKRDGFWLEKLLEHPEIMTQGETLKELEENIKDAFRLMALDDVQRDRPPKLSALLADLPPLPDDAFPDEIPDRPAEPVETL